MPLQQLYCWIVEAGKSLIPNTNREKKVKYQHPKGAPDADLIFGSGPKKYVPYDYKS